MKKKMMTIAAVFLAFAASVPVATAADATAAAVAGDVKQYNVVWDSPGTNSWGSMPIGNGDIGANVWVEPSGDPSSPAGSAGASLVLLLSKTDSWDEVSRLCKLGRIRIKLPSVENFRQELRLVEGEILITAGGTTTRVWIDANRPVAHVEIIGGKPFTTAVTHETWRTTERLLKGGEIRSCWGLAKPYYSKGLTRTRTKSNEKDPRYEPYCEPYEL